MSPAPPVRVFYSYAHKDEALLDQLDQHLSPLRRQGLIEPWHDRDIRAGQEWSQAIEDHLDASQLVLLLISPAFIASEFCYNIELPQAMARHDRRQAQVIPIHLRPVNWKGASFAKLQALPPDAKAVSAWDNEDVAFTTIAAGIQRAAESIRGVGDNAPIVHAPLTPNTPMRHGRRRMALALLMIIIAAAGGYCYLQVRQVKPLLAEGKRQLSIGRYAQAKTAYQQAGEQGWYGRWAAGLGLQKASIYDFENGEFRAAEVRRRIDLILEQRPNDPHAYLFKGDLAYIGGDLDEAAAFYQQAMQHDPNLAQAYFNLGVIHDRRGNANAALSMYQQAIERAPQHSPYLNNLAHAYAQRQRYEEAIENYKRALSFAPDLLITYFDLARIYRRRNNAKLALRYLRQGAQKLDQPDLANHEQNQQAWSFSLDDGSQRLTLDTLERKRCYAYRALAVALQTVDPPQAEPYARAPCDLSDDDAQDIQSWISRDARTLHHEQKPLR